MIKKFFKTIFLANLVVSLLASIVGAQSIDVSTINATATTPYGGINITSNTFVQGNLGIGTTNSQQKLEISGNIATTGQIISSGTGNNYFAGNIGIGITNPITTLHIIDTANQLRISSSIYATGTYFTADATSIGSRFGIMNTNGNPQTFFNSDGISYINYQSHNLGIGTVTPDQKLTITGNISQTGNFISSGTGNNYFAGKIGIGNTSPQNKLHVVDPITFPQIIVSSSPNPPFANAGLGAYAVGSFLRLTDENYQQQTFLYANNIGANSYINRYGGNLGIGTAEPIQKLDVSGNISQTGNFISSGTENNYFAGNIFADKPAQVSIIARSGGIDSSTYTQISAFQNGAFVYLRHYGDKKIYLRTDGNSYFNTDYNIGIGITDPVQKLDISGNISQTGQIISSGTGNNYFAGNIGIGVTNPSSKLEIVSGGILTVSSLTTNSGIENIYFSTSVKIGGYSLPFDDGPTNYVLKTDGAGAVFWSSAGSGDAILSATQTFTGQNTFNNQTTFGKNIIVISSMSVSGSGLSGTTPVFQVIGGTMTVLANGNIGVGTTAPNDALHVYRAYDSGGGTGANASTIFIDGNTGQDTWLGWGTAGVAKMVAGIDNGGNSVNFWGHDGSNWNLGMAITTSGKVGIGDTNPSARLSVNGYILGTWPAISDNAMGYDTPTGVLAVGTSDERLKKNLEPVTNVLGDILKIPVYKHNAIDEKDTDKKRYGVMAQDILPLFPELVYTVKYIDEKEYYGVHYDKLPVVLLKAIQEQQVIIEDLKAKLKSKGVIE